MKNVFLVAMLGLVLTAALVLAGCSKQGGSSGGSSSGEGTAKSSGKETPASDFVCELYGNGVIITQYKGKNTTVVIPAEIEGFPVVALFRAFVDNTTIKSITIPDSVTSIGRSTFKGCLSLASIKIPNSVKEIGNDSFNGCGLTSITIPDSVTVIGESAFADCKNLTSVTILGGVEDIWSYAFANCERLTSITIPNSVKEIGKYAFGGCKSLASITIPDVLHTFIRGLLPIVRASQRLR